MTLGDKIRKMSDEELATYLANITHASAASGASFNTEFPSFLNLVTLDKEDWLKVLTHESN